MKLVFVFSALFIPIFCLAQTDSVYHILANDTSYYEVYEDKNSPVVRDGVEYRRKENAPDGIYYIYQVYGGYNSSSVWVTDTATYEIARFKNGKKNGMVYSYFYKTNRLMSKSYVVNDTILWNDVYADSDDEFCYHYVFKEGIPYQYTYSKKDSSGSKIFEEGYLDVCYTPVYIPGHFLRKYHDNGTMKEEKRITNDQLIWKLWCKDGTLYFHYVATIHRNEEFPNGISYPGESVFVTDDRIIDPLKGAIGPCSE